jgi:3-phenylpropionate/cinnamic acid dioxygenase small subunit
MMAVDRQQVENFLYREARLMDDNAYDAWLDLYAADALYWVPCNADDIDPARQISIYYDNRERLEERITRLKSGAAHAQEPKSRLLRLISNVEIGDAADNGDITVYANFHLTELRRSRQRLIAGRTQHKLRPTDGSFKIVLRKVMLLTNDEVIDNLTFLI